MVVVRGRIDPVGRALWYVETHFDQAITLEEVFGIATGSGLMHTGRRTSSRSLSMRGTGPTRHSRARFAIASE
jgi:hypothetical protein